MYRRKNPQIFSSIDLPLRCPSSNDVAVHLPDILFLARNPLRGLEWIASDHCDAVALAKELVRSEEVQCGGEDWPPEHRVHVHL